MSIRILYVEDEFILGRLVKEALEKQGYEVELITSGSDALPAYRRCKPQLCLLDIMLPGRDGYEVARQLRALDQQLPILFLTAKVETADLVAGFKAGCNDYIRKPFSMDELLLRLQTWLRERYGDTGSVPPELIRMGADCLYPQQLLLVGNGHTIRLTHKEAALLLLLHQHRNTIIRRDFLQQKIWGAASAYHSRSLDVYITRLRSYFRQSPQQIITLKGIGYRFLCPE